MARRDWDQYISPTRIGIAIFTVGFLYLLAIILDYFAIVIVFTRSWDWWLTEAGAGIGGLATLLLALLYLGLYGQTKSQTDALKASYAPKLDTSVDPEPHWLGMDIINRGEGTATNIRIKVSAWGCDQPQCWRETAPNDSSAYVGGVNQSLRPNQKLTSTNVEETTSPRTITLRPKFYYDKRNGGFKIGDIRHLYNHYHDLGFDLISLKVEVAYSDINEEIEKHDEVYGYIEVDDSRYFENIDRPSTGTKVTVYGSLKDLWGAKFRNIVKEHLLRRESTTPIMDETINLNPREVD